MLPHLPNRTPHPPCTTTPTEWLQAKDKRMQQEQKEQSALKKTIEHELEFINRKAKGQQKKGQARMRRYDDLVQQANAYVRNTQVG